MERKGKEMTKKIMVIMSAIWLAMPVFSFAKEKAETDSEVDAYEQKCKLGT